MSTNDEWGRPTRTAKGQFTKGTSGNPRGRPKKKERGYTPSQGRNDFLDLTEVPVSFKTQGKSRTRPIILAIYWQMLLKAASGDKQMIMAVINFRRELLDEHRRHNLDVVEGAEQFERMLAKNGDRIHHPETMDLLNERIRASKGRIRGS